MVTLARMSVQVCTVKIFSTFTFTFTAASTLLSGGLERLKSSPGNFFVALKFME
jgi:hypothetical protein